jgi:hypothetical protein
VLRRRLRCLGASKLRHESIRVSGDAAAHVSRHKVEVSGQLHALLVLPLGKEHSGLAG